MLLLNNSWVFMTTPSIFARLGYTVREQLYCAYRLQQRDLRGKLTYDGVGLLYAPVPIDEATHIELFELNGLDPATGAWMAGRDINDMLVQWGMMDARRIGESGLYSLPLDLADVSPGPVLQDRLTMPRPEPEEGRLRHYAILYTGDHVCYN